MRYRNSFWADHVPATAAVLAMLAAVAVAHGQAGPDGGPPGDGPPDRGSFDGRPPGGGGGGGGSPFDGPPPLMMHHHRPTTGPAEVASPVSGTVEAYNRDPRGRINGIVVRDGEHVVQLNAPPDWAGSLETAAPLKDAVSATAVPEVVAGDRTVERLVTLSGHGLTLSAGTPGEPRRAHVDGTVTELNYTPHGEVDGALLDTGDFVHVGPPGAAQLKLATGQKLSVDGRAAMMTDGHQAVEAETVNGTSIPRPPHPRREGPGMGPMHGGPGQRGGPGGPGGGYGSGAGGPGSGGGPDREPDALGNPSHPGDDGPDANDPLMPPS